MGFSQELGADPRNQGVGRLVSFGIKPAKVDEGLIELLRTQEGSVQSKPERLLKLSERVRLTEVPFAGIEDTCQMADGEC